MRSFLFSIITLVIAAVNSHAEIPVNYQHKSIDKEIKKAFNIESYHQKSFIPEDSMLNNGMIGSCFLITNNNNFIGYSYIGRVNSCRTGGCNSNNSETESGHEYFDYLVLFDNNGAVTRIKVFNYQATHGQEVCSKGWLKQFIGFTGDESLRVGKEIDAISGATISVYSITTNIQYISAILNSQLKSP